MYSLLHPNRSLSYPGFLPEGQDGPTSVRSDVCHSDLAWPRAHQPADRPQTTVSE